MKSNKFIDKLQNIFSGYRTVYMWGVFGAPVTDALIASKAAQYPDWYGYEKCAALRKLVGKGYFGFDCVSLIKGVLWGWTGSMSKSNGGAIYSSKGVPDISADGLIYRAIDVSTDFSNIVGGEVVWREGHVGVYIGNGKVIECTPRWSNEVQVTCCLNVANIPSMNGRIWTKHGKIPYIDYGLSEATYVAAPEGDSIVKVVQQLCNDLRCLNLDAIDLDVDGVSGPLTIAAIKNLPTVKQGSKGTSVRAIQSIVGGDADGDFGSNTAYYVKKWQIANSLDNDGVVGPMTWAKMAKI